MAAATLSDLDEALRYLQDLVPLDMVFSEEILLWNFFQRKVRAIPAGGRSWLVPLRDVNEQGIGWRAEGGTLPTAIAGSFRELTVPRAYLYAKGAISGQAIQFGSRENFLAASDSLQDSMRSTQRQLAMEINFHLFGTGSGAITQANGAGSVSTALTVDDSSGLFNNMVIDIYTAEYTGGSQNVNSIAISSVNSATGVTLASAQSWAGNAYIFREDSRNLAILGLRGIVDDGSLLSSIYGITRSSRRDTKSQRVTSVGALTTDANRLKFVKIIQDAMSIGGGEVKMFITTAGVYRAFLGAVMADFHYTIPVRVEGPYQFQEFGARDAIVYPGMPPVMWDKDAAASSVLGGVQGMCWGIVPEHFTILQTRPPHLRDDDGLRVRASQTVDQVEYDYRWYANLLCRRLPSQVVLTGITEA